MTADQFFHHIRLMLYYESRYTKTSSYADRKKYYYHKNIIKEYVKTQVSKYNKGELFV